MPRLYTSGSIFVFTLSLAACSQSGSMAPMSAQMTAAPANTAAVHVSQSVAASAIDAAYATSSASATPLHTAIPSPSATPVKASSVSPSPGMTPTPVPGNPTFYVAGDIADSIGVNANLLPYPTMQPLDATELGVLIGAAHIRHYRAGIDVNNALYVKNILAFDLASHARPMFETDCNPKVGQNGLTLPADIRAFNIAIGDAADAIEGVNEPDTRHAQDPDFQADLDACQATESSAIPSLPYVAPAVAQAGRYQYVGFIPNMTVANIHRYLSGHNPGTLGYGPSHYCGFEYASIEYNKCYAAGEAGSGKPFYETETGWNTDSGEVDLATQAKYDTRSVLYNWIHGVTRTYFNPLVSYTGVDGFGGDSLLKADRSPKPSYYALKTLLNILADDGRPVGFKATPRSFGVAGASASVIVVPMQKSNGPTVVAIWNETLSYDSSNKAPIVVPAQSITMSIPADQVVGTVRSITDSGSMTSTWFKWSGQNIVFPIDDHVTLVTFVNSVVTATK